VRGVADNLCRPDGDEGEKEEGGGWREVKQPMSAQEWTEFGGRQQASAAFESAANGAVELASLVLVEVASAALRLRHWSAQQWAAVGLQAAADYDAALTQTRVSVAPRIAQKLPRQRPQAPKDAVGEPVHTRVAGAFDPGALLDSSDISEAEEEGDEATASTVPETSPEPELEAESEPLSKKEKAKVAKAEKQRLKTAAKAARKQAADSSQGQAKSMDADVQPSMGQPLTLAQFLDVCETCIEKHWKQHVDTQSVPPSPRATARGLLHSGMLETIKKGTQGKKVKWNKGWGVVLDGGVDYDNGWQPELLIFTHEKAAKAAQKKGWDSGALLTEALERVIVAPEQPPEKKHTVLCLRLRCTAPKQHLVDSDQKTLSKSEPDPEPEPEPEPEVDPEPEPEVDPEPEPEVEPEPEPEVEPEPEPEPEPTPQLAELDPGDENVLKLRIASSQVQAWLSILAEVGTPPPSWAAAAQEQREARIAERAAATEAADVVEATAEVNTAKQQLETAQAALHEIKFVAEAVAGTADAEQFDAELHQLQTNVEVATAQLQAAEDRLQKEQAEAKHAEKAALQKRAQAQAIGGAAAAAAAKRCSHGATNTDATHNSLEQVVARILRDTTDAEGLDDVTVVARLRVLHEVQQAELLEALQVRLGEAQAAEVFTSLWYAAAAQTSGAPLSDRIASPSGDVIDAEALDESTVVIHPYLALCTGAWALRQLDESAAKEEQSQESPGKTRFGTQKLSRQRPQAPKDAVGEPVHTRVAGAFDPGAFLDSSDESEAEEDDMVKSEVSPPRVPSRLNNPLRHLGSTRDQPAGRAAPSIPPPARQHANDPSVGALEHEVAALRAQLTAAMQGITQLTQLMMLGGGAATAAGGTTTSTFDHSGGAATTPAPSAGTVPGCEAVYENGKLQKLAAHGWIHRRDQTDLLLWDRCHATLHATATPPLAQLLLVTTELALAEAQAHARAGRGVDLRKFQLHASGGVAARLGKPYGFELSAVARDGPATLALAADSEGDWTYWMRAIDAALDMAQPVLLRRMWQQMAEQHGSAPKDGLKTEEEPEPELVHEVKLDPEPEPQLQTEPLAQPEPATVPASEPEPNVLTQKEIEKLVKASKAAAVKAGVLKQYKEGKKKVNLYPAAATIYQDGMSLLKSKDYFAAKQCFDSSIVAMADPASVKPVQDMEMEPEPQPEPQPEHDVEPELQLEHGLEPSPESESEPEPKLEPEQETELTGLQNQLTQPAGSEAQSSAQEVAKATDGRRSSAELQLAEAKARRKKRLSKSEEEDSHL
jgi:hypothetical protein